jgi:hypothetical protein
MQTFYLMRTTITKKVAMSITVWLLPLPAHRADCPGAGHQAVIFGLARFNLRSETNALFALFKSSRLSCSGLPSNGS